MVTLWIFIGLFYLIFCVFQDMYFYMKILCDYGEDDVDLESKKIEDKMQDNIVIYNEIIDTMRAVFNLFKYKMKKHKIKKTKKPKEPPREISFRPDEVE